MVTSTRESKLTPTEKSNDLQWVAQVKMSAGVSRRASWQQHGSTETTKKLQTSNLFHRVGALPQSPNQPSLAPKTGGSRGPDGHVTWKQNNNNKK